ncbi:unnamed protein product [Prunus armeniaca]|uniref:Uncharacterized protein n=1 Tax=Prunus armeniaca TaxID=36596 RepID=A0A6J5V900_PRUAR|nr:unnamed protein product [Prunus armeniaca]
MSYWALKNGPFLSSSVLQRVDYFFLWDQGLEFQSSGPYIALGYEVPVLSGSCGSGFGSWR